MSERRADVGELVRDFVARATGQRSPGYVWKGHAVEAAAAIVDEINSRPRPKLADALGVEEHLPTDSRAGLVEELLRGLEGIERKHGLEGSLEAGANGYSLRFVPAKSSGGKVW